MMERQWQGKTQSATKKSCLTATLPTTNPTWTVIILKLLYNGLKFEIFNHIKKTIVFIVIWLFKKRFLKRRKWRYRVGVPKAVLLKIQVFWDVTSCRWSNSQFLMSGRLMCFRLQRLGKLSPDGEGSTILWNLRNYYPTSQKFRIF